MSEQLFCDRPHVELTTSCPYAAIHLREDKPFGLNHIVFLQR
jgi:hypothetical protein